MAPFYEILDATLGVDNIPSEVLKNGSEVTITVLTAICQKIWEMECPKELVS